jgi:hypothetical protein
MEPRTRRLLSATNRAGEKGYALRMGAEVRENLAAVSRAKMAVPDGAKDRCASFGV